MTIEAGRWLRMLAVVATVTGCGPSVPKLLADGRFAEACSEARERRTSNADRALVLAQTPAPALGASTIIVRRLSPEELNHLFALNDVTAASEFELVAVQVPRMLEFVLEWEGSQATSARFVMATARLQREPGGVADEAIIDHAQEVLRTLDVVGALSDDELSPDEQMLPEVEVELSAAVIESLFANRPIANESPASRLQSADSRYQAAAGALLRVVRDSHCRNDHCARLLAVDRDLPVLRPSFRSRVGNCILRFEASPLELNEFTSEASEHTLTGFQAREFE